MDSANNQMTASEAREHLKGSMSEDDLHRACVRWADAQAAAEPALNALFHPPNGGQRDARAGARMKKLGAKAGVPDLCLPVQRTVTVAGDRQTVGGLWIELKSANGRLRESQAEWRDRLIRYGHAWALCRTLEGFQSRVLDYLNGDFWLDPEADSRP